MSESSDAGLLTGADGIIRCWWAGSTPEYLAYHDSEWGRPVSDDMRLFEKLSLEGFQAGLSWLTILRKRDARRGKLDRARLAQLTVTPESTALAKDLKRRGWRFVGPTTVYAFMQSMGLVNDHLDGCEAKAGVDAARRRFKRP